LDKNMRADQADETLREWRENARYWRKHAAMIRTMFSPLTQALIEEARINEGDKVLDVAGGAGEPSLTIADSVGPTGSVTYTDVAPEMVAAAKEEAQRRKLKNVVFEHCSADHLPFDSETFDVAVCRFGAMFFPDPHAALREMLRVTKPEGVVALAVWGKAELNPYSYVITNIVASHFEPEPADSNVLGAFRFGEPGSLARILSEAGAVEVKERVFKFDIAAPISPREFWELRSETSGTLREKLATIDSTQRESIADEVQKAVREFFPNDKMKFPANVIIISGTSLLIRR
jgi:ubiquinone/menaquinone biosynthesis C-methylase UbiE